MAAEQTPVGTEKRLKFLVIRRDNIGDLVCTTPVIAALRETFPSAEICALVTSYNRAVVENNPAIDRVFWYSKAKHQPGVLRKLAAHWHRIRVLARLRSMGFDYAVIPAPGYEPRALRLARLVGVKRVVGFGEAGGYRPGDLVVPVPPPMEPAHEAERAFRVLTPLGIDGQPGPVRVFPHPDALRRALARIAARGWGKRPVIAVHISARKPSQRWPAERFAALIAALHERYQAGFLLFWSPGDASNPTHPGDDDKAAAIMEKVEALPVLAFPTAELPELIGGIAACDAMVCSDGGAMHLAAGLGKPILCFFGKSDATHWRPWEVPHELLQAESQEVADISVEEALEAFGRLMAATGTHHS